jgi:hypothetical protein
MKTSLMEALQDMTITFEGQRTAMKGAEPRVSSGLKSGTMSFEFCELAEASDPILIGFDDCVRLKVQIFRGAGGKPWVHFGALGLSVPVEEKRGAPPAAGRVLLSPVTDQPLEVQMTAPTGQTHYGPTVVEVAVAATTLPLGFQG